MENFGFTLPLGEIGLPSKTVATGHGETLNGRSKPLDYTPLPQGSSRQKSLTRFGGGGVSHIQGVFGSGSGHGSS
jgi:hypothetical protein